MPEVAVYVTVDALDAPGVHIEVGVVTGIVGEEALVEADVGVVSGDTVVDASEVTCVVDVTREDVGGSVDVVTVIVDEGLPLEVSEVICVVVVVVVVEAVDVKAVGELEAGTEVGDVTGIDVADVPVDKVEVIVLDVVVVVVLVVGVVAVPVLDA